MQGVLNGIRVLDFGRFIAGPYCGMLLADFGAEVIRVDKIGGSEDRYILPLAESGMNSSKTLGACSKSPQTYVNMCNSSKIEY